MNIRHIPRISRAGFIRILEGAHSPAAPAAGACYDLVQDYDLDPAVALAMFQHESTYGTKGAAVETHNWGNVRPPANGWLQAHGLHDGQNSSWLLFRRRPGEPEGFEWLRSCEIWCLLISELYIGRWGLLTVEAAIQKYAPVGDGNKPNAYAAAVIRAVELWAREFPPAGPVPLPEPPAPEFVARAEFVALVARVDHLEDCRGIDCRHTWPAAEFGPATTAGTTELGVSP